jgi:hypothetical protein
MAVVCCCWCTNEANPLDEGYICDICGDFTCNYCQYEGHKDYELYAKITYIICDYCVEQILIDHITKSK